MGVIAIQPMATKTRPGSKTSSLQYVLQIVLLRGVAMPNYLMDAAQELVQTHVWPFWALWGLSFVTILVLGFSQAARRRYPW